VIAALVLPALVVVAMAARSYQPFGGEGGGRRATSATVLDNTVTVVAVLGILVLLVGVWAWFQAFTERPKGRGRQAPFASLVAVVAAITLAAVVAGSDILQNDGRPSRAQGSADLPLPAQVVPEKPAAELEPESAQQINWPLAIGLAVLVAIVIGAVIVIDRRRDRREVRTRAELERLVRALDEAIEDLRRDPDPRRAVVAAYARMEQALSVYGLPRRPAEAPYEYLGRIGLELEAEEPVAALTELFEVAKFSEHSVDEAMRGRAIDALTAVRAEVRAEAT
jgi:hypothetical protein